MPTAPPSRAERFVRSLLLLATSALLSLIAWYFGLYQSHDQTRIVVLILAIVIAAVLVSRLGAKALVRRFGWN
ncbi:MAG: hypothetical protein ACREFW_00670 [Rhizomicrobium sp.]